MAVFPGKKKGDGKTDSDLVEWGKTIEAFGKALIKQCNLRAAMIWVPYRWPAGTDIVKNLGINAK